MKLSCFLPVVVLLCGAFANATEQEQDESLGLVLSGYNKVESGGCYNFNQSMSLCFHIHPSSMELTTKKGKILILSRQMGTDLFLFQMSDVRFLSFKTRMIAIPADAPTSPDELVAYWHRNYGPKYKLSGGDVELLKLNYERALEKLRKTPEVLLIELVSSALAHQKHQVEAMASFHQMCLTILKGLAVQLPAEFQAVEQQYAGREKRCPSLKSDPNGDNCLGMCGKKCNCWWWICGDCCYTRGCYEHDRCCGADPNSTYCKKPWRYRFRCSSYGGYPKCLE